jgi:hypothetical protein
MNKTRSRGVVIAGLAAVAIVAAACGSTASKAAAPVGGQSTGLLPPNSSSTTAPAGPETNSPGDIPDNQAFVSFKPAGGTYSVTVPEGWAQSTNGAATVFTDKFNTVQIETTSAPTAPTTDSVTATVVPALQSANANFSLGKVATVTRSAGDAVLATYQADSSPNPVTGKVIPLAFERYTFWHNGTEVTLTLSGSTNADNVDPWKKITDSFTWTA